MKLKITLLQLIIYLAWFVVQNDAKVVGNVNDADDPGTITIVNIQDDNKTQYLNQNFELGSYNYGYDIKPSGPVGQFHHESKGPDDVVYGCYGYEAPDSPSQMTFYISDAWGYRPVRQEDDIEIFYPADNPPGTGHMNGQKTKWADLIFPEMCAHLAERIASSSNVVTNGPTTLGSSHPAGSKFQTSFQPNTVGPVTVPQPSTSGFVKNTPGQPAGITPSTFGRPTGIAQITPAGSTGPIRTNSGGPTGNAQTNSPVPSDSFDVIHLNTPSNPGTTASNPSRFTNPNNRPSTPASGNGFTHSGRPGTPSSGISTNTPSSPSQAASNTNPISEQSTGNFPPIRFSTPSGSTSPGGNTPTRGGSSINNSRPPFPSTPTGNTGNPNQSSLNEIQTTSNIPESVTDEQSSNVGPLFPNRPGASASTSQPPVSNNIIPFTQNQGTTTRQPPSSNFNQGFRTSTPRPTNFNNLSTGTNQRPTQRPTGTTRTPFVASLANTVGTGTGFPGVTTNEVPVGSGNSGTRQTNGGLPSTRPPSQIHSGNPYGNSDDDDLSVIAPITPANPNPSTGQATRTPTNRVPTRPSSGFNNGGSTTGSFSPTIGNRNPTTHGSSTGPASNTNRGSSTGSTPQFSSPQGSTTFGVPDRSQTTQNIDNEQNTIGSSTFINPGSKVPSTSPPLATRPSSSSQFTNRPPTQNTNRPPTVTGTGGNRQTNGFRQPTPGASNTPLTRPSTGFSGNVNNPSTLQPSSTVQQNVPSQSGPGDTSSTPNQFENSVSVEGSSVGIFNPTNQPTGNQFGGSRFTNTVSQNTPAPFIPEEPDTDIYNPHGSTPSPTTNINTPSRNTIPQGTTFTGNGQFTREPTSGNTGAGTDFGTRRPSTFSTPTRSPTSASTRIPTTRQPGFQRPQVGPVVNHTGTEQTPDDEFCTSQCSSCKQTNEPPRDEDFSQIPGAILSNIPVIFYPDCSANAYSRPAIVPFCPSQKSQCDNSQPLTMKFPDAPSFGNNHDLPVARNAFASNNNRQSTRVARKVRRGRQQRILRT
ncbi:unnamed protein product [Orchesella dallaii]|uniref:Uncharacterized protein n=1 Tax=Orchesella dallaii TaxID=48710 RepID=A0ABP1R2Y0_9HEXA